MPVLPSAADRLLEARIALHALLTGQQEAEVRDSNGESVRYTSANASRLREYIAQLEAEVAGLNPIKQRAPLRPIWS